MNKKWKPIVAGLLEILAGFATSASAIYVLGMLYVLIPHPWEDPSLAGWPMIQFIVALLQLLLFFAVGLFGIVSLVGGVCALLRRRWGLALAGAIATVPLFSVGGFLLRDFVGITNPFLSALILLILSIAIIILIIRSKKEFE